MTDEELDQRVRESVHSEALDTSRLEAAVRNQIQEHPRHVPGWAVAAAALIATVLAANFSYRTFLKERATPPLCVAAAQDHKREIVNDDPRHWLTDLPAIQALAAKHSVPPSAIAALNSTGYQLERGRLCFLDQQIFVHLVYNKDGREFSVYLRPRIDGSHFDASVREASVGSEEVAYFQSRALTAVFVDHQSALDQSKQEAAAFARAGAKVL